MKGTSVPAAGTHRSKDCMNPDGIDSDLLTGFPEALQDLASYLKLNPTGKKGKPGTYIFRVMITKHKNLQPRRYEFGLKTRFLAEAVKRAGELVSLLDFCGWHITSCKVNVDALMRLFPLSDLSDDLGRDREDESTPGFYGGNAGLPFLICWPPDTPPRFARPLKS